MGPELQADSAEALHAAVSPASDPGFATNKVHGEIAQRELLRQVVKLCKQRRTAVDVGAHIGLWSRNLAPKFKQVLAFEPERANAECFLKNVAGMKNVYLAGFALGDQAGTASVSKQPGDNSGMWRLVPPLPKAEQQCQVQPLDAGRLTDVDLIKIDTEGFEGRVIRGAVETIQTSRPVIVFEHNGLGPKYFGTNWINPIPELKMLGYKLRFTWRKDQVWVPA